MEVHGSLTDEGRVQWGREAVLQARGSHKHATAVNRLLPHSCAGAGVLRENASATLSPASSR